MAPSADLRTPAATPKPRCGYCGSPDVRFSYPRFRDYLLARFRHFEVFRCRSCQHRFRLYINR